MDLAKLKALLGIEDDSKDMVLEFVIADVEEIIKNYCHVEKMPDGLINTGYRMGTLLPHSVSMWMTILRAQC